MHAHFIFTENIILNNDSIRKALHVLLHKMIQCVPTQQKKTLTGYTVLNKLCVVTIACMVSFGDSKRFPVKPHRLCCQNEYGNEI
jgi:predicted transcriptional regulator